MANGANRLFRIMKKISKNMNPSSSKIVSLTVKTTSPLIFQRDDRLEIPEDFCTFNNLIQKNELRKGDVVTALVLNNGQSYFIQQLNN